MFFRLSTLCLLLPVLLLAGCSSNKNAFAPACPRAAILADAADLLRYRDGGGRDLTDLVLSARILGVSGDCKPGETSRQLATQMQVTFEVTRGPAMGQRDVDMMLFVAVSDQDQILDKKLFPVHVVFPSNVEIRRGLCADRRVPTDAGRTGPEPVPPAALMRRKAPIRQSGG